MSSPPRATGYVAEEKNDGYGEEGIKAVVKGESVEPVSSMEPIATAASELSVIESMEGKSKPDATVPEPAENAVAGTDNTGDRGEEASPAKEKGKALGSAIDNIEGGAIDAARTDSQDVSSKFSDDEEAKTDVAEDDRNRDDDDGSSVPPDNDSYLETLTVTTLNSERSSSIGDDYNYGDVESMDSPDTKDRSRAINFRANSAPRHRTPTNIPTIFEEDNIPMRPATAPGKAPLFPVHQDYESENEDNSSIAYTRHQDDDFATSVTQSRDHGFESSLTPSLAPTSDDEEDEVIRGLMKGQTRGGQDMDGSIADMEREPTGDEFMHDHQDEEELLDEPKALSDDDEDDEWKVMEDVTGTTFLLNTITGEQKRVFAQDDRREQLGSPSWTEPPGVPRRTWQTLSPSPLRRVDDEGQLYSRRTPKKNTLKRANQSADKFVRQKMSESQRSLPSPISTRKGKQKMSVSAGRGGLLAASSVQYLPVRVVVHRANAKGEISENDRSRGGQMVDVPANKYKRGRVSEAARKEAFEEFLYDVAIRLQMAERRDPLAAPSSPSRRRRAERIRTDLKELEALEKEGKYVDPVYIGQLENKLRLMEEAEFSSAGAIFSKLKKNKTKPIKEKGALDGGGSLYTPRDMGRFSLWHATYRAQIVDFDSIRSGDMLLLRDSNDASSDAQFQDGLNSGGSAVGGSLASIQGIQGADTSKAILRVNAQESSMLTDTSTNNDDTEKSKSSSPSNVIGESEDKLRLRRLGLSQLLNAIRSKRSLFGVPLEGAKAAFNAMDRRGKGVISVNDFGAAMHRLDIKMPKSAVFELAKLVGNGNDVRYPEFLTALRMAAGDELAFAEEAPSEYGGDDEDSGVSDRRSVPERLQKRHRRKRKTYKSLPIDRRPDEDLVWDIEAAPENPEPLRVYAERLIARRQYPRALDYLERSLAAAQRNTFRSEKTLDLKWTSKHKSQLQIMLRLATLNSMMEQFDGAEQVMQESIIFAVGHHRAEPLAAYAILMERLRQFDKAEEAYLRALALDAECTTALLGYANLLVDIRADHSTAEMYYKRALRCARMDVHDNDVPLVIAKRSVTDAYLNYAVFLSTLRGDHSKALDLLEHATKVQPEKNAPVLVELGRVHAAHGDMTTQHILQHYEAALRIDPDYADAKLELAMILSSRSKDPRDQRRALGFFEQVLEKDPNNGATLLAMARHLDFTNAGAPVQIEQLYRRAITAIDGEARLARGRPAIQPWEPRMSLATYLEFKRRDPQRAGSMYEEAVRLAPFEPECLVALGVFRKTVVEDIDGAEAMFHKALDADPLHGAALVAMGDLLWTARGESEAAEIMYKRAANVAGKKDATALRSYALFQASRGRDKAAASLFRKAVKADPKHAPTRAAYGIILMYKLKDYEVAERELLKAIELDPTQNVEALHHLGRLYEEQVLEMKSIVSDGGYQGRERALRCYRNALAVEPEHIPTLIRMGLLLKTVATTAHPSEARSTLDRAEECLARAAAAGPDDADPNYEMGAFLLGRGANRFGAARRHLQRAISLDPCHVLAMDALAETHVSAKEPDYKKAEGIWVQALDVNPANAPSIGDYVQFLENIRSRCVTAEARVLREDSPDAARALVLYQQLRRYSTLKAIYASKSEELGDSTWLRHNRSYLKAFRTQFEQR